MTPKTNTRKRTQRAKAIGRHGAARGSVCGEPALPANWGKVEVPHGVGLRPLTEKDLAGYSKEEWQQIVESEKRRTPNDQAQRPGPLRLKNNSAA